MIHAAVVVMTVMGCGDQGHSCDLIPKPQKTWQSLQKCDAAIPAVLRGSTNSPYPVITAHCDLRAGPVPSAQSKTAAAAPSQNQPGYVDQATEPRVFAKVEKQPERGIVWSMSDAVLHKTRSGYLLVRGGATGVFELIQNGALGSFAGVRGGVRAASNMSVIVAKRTVVALRGKVEFED